MQIEVESFGEQNNILTKNHKHLASNIYSCRPLELRLSSSCDGGEFLLLVALEKGKLFPLLFFLVNYACKYVICLVVD